MSTNWGGLNIGYQQDSTPEITNSQVSKVIPDWVFELKSGWGQGAAPETVDPFIERVEPSEIENNTCIVNVNLAQFNAINGHEGCRMKEISVLAGCDIQEVVPEEETDRCEKDIKILGTGEHAERNITNAVWLMDVCINVYVELGTTIIPLKAGTQLEQVVTSEAYGLPPLADEEASKKNAELKNMTPQQKYAAKQRKVLEQQLKQMQEMQQQMGMGGMGMQMSMNFGNQGGNNHHQGGNNHHHQQNNYHNNYQNNYHQNNNHHHNNYQHGGGYNNHRGRGRGRYNKNHHNNW